MSERDVIFNLRAVCADDGKRGFDQMRDALAGLRKEIEGAERAAASSVATATQRAMGQIVTMRDMLTRAAGQMAQPAMTQPTPMTTPARAASTSATGATDPVRRQQLLSAMNMEGVAAAEAKTEKELEGIWKARQRVVAQFYATQRSEREAAAKEQEKAEKDALRGLERQAKEADRLASQTSRAAAKAAQDESRQIQSIEKERERALGRAAASTDKFYERVASATEGVARFGRGLATLGVLGEDSTDSLIRGLAKVQAGFDVFVGGVKFIRDAQKAIEAWRAASTAATLAQQLSGAASSKAAVQSAELTAALAAEKVAADAAAAAQTRLAAARAASTVAGAGKGAAGLISGMGGLGSLLTGLGGLGGLGGGLAGAGGGAAAAGGGTVAAGGAAAGGVAVAPVAAAVAAILGGIAGVASAGSSINAGRKYGFMGGAEQGTLTSAIADREVRVANWMGLTSGLAGSEAKTARLEKERARSAEAAEIRKRMADEDTQMSSMRAGANAQLWSMRDRTLDAQGVGGYRDELMRMRVVAASANKEENFPEREAAEKRIADIHSRIADLTKERGETEKRTAETRLRSVQDAIKGIQDEIALRKQAEKNATDQYNSGKEKFGSMSATEQWGIMRLKARADAAANAAMSDEDKSFMSQADRYIGSGGTLDAAAAARREAIQKARARAGASALSQEERQRLASVGTSETDAISKEGNQVSAERMGYDRYFGAEERRNVMQAQAVQQRLKVELKDKRIVAVNINDDMNETARIVANQVSAHLAQRDEILRRQIMAELGRNTDQQQEQQARQTANRRAVYQ